MQEVENKSTNTIPKSVTMEKDNGSDKDVYGLDPVTFEPEATGHNTGNAKQVWNFNIYLIFIGIILFGLFYGTLVYAQYPLLAYALGQLNSYDLNGIPDVISVLFSLLLAPLYAKLSDIFGRFIVLFTVILMLASGNLIIGLGNDNFICYTVGKIISDLGESGRYLMIPIVIADLMITENRALGYMLFWFPGLIAIFTSIPIIEPAKEHGWYWTYIAQAIGSIVFSSPLLIGIYRQNKLIKNKDAADSTKVNDGENKIRNIIKILKDIDIIGLIFLTLSLSLILLPFTIVIREPLGWASPKIISMLCVGVVVLVGLIVWEKKYSSNPLIPTRLFVNRNLVLLIVVQIILKLEFTINWLYFTSYIIISRDMAETHAAFIVRCFQIAWFVSGVLSAALMKKFKLVRVLIQIGIVIHIAGLALSIPARNPSTPEGLVIASEILIGLGSGFVDPVLIAMYQSTVDFKDIATISYIVLLAENVMSSIGSAVGTSIWNRTLADNLIYYLPTEISDQVPDFLADLYKLRELPLEIKDGWLNALGDTQLVMCAVSVAIACLSLVVALFLKPFKL